MYGYFKCSDCGLQWSAKLHFKDKRRNVSKPHLALSNATLIDFWNSLEFALPSGILKMKEHVEALGNFCPFSKVLNSRTISSSATVGSADPVTN
ncbi:hypothetical protein MAR_038049 [Mya arenaria]|uniref:Transposase n=1 Tax=Mya arenaria TaxID=6604 RepID=A0ABY7FQ97_MYAAR|nr:hypothetical protein MAR_038049 [Mya arenaria]